MDLIYTELNRRSLPHGGYRIIGRFDDADPSGNFTITKRFYVNSPYPTQEEADAKVADVSVNVEFDLNPLNQFNLGVGAERPKVTTLVVTVRSDPFITQPDLVTALDTAHPAMIWKPAKFLSHLRSYLDDEMGQSYTYPEFRVFLIENKFIGVD